MAAPEAAGPQRTTTALDVLVERLFDYAGPFPPASLPLAEALAETARLEGTLHRPAMVAADLVVPWDRLALITQDALAHAGFPAGRTLHLCCVGLDAPDTRGAAGAAVVRNQEHREDPTPQKVVSLEAALPEDLPTQEGPLAAQLREARDRLQATGARLYVEPRWTPKDWQRDGQRLLDLVSSLPGVGLKVRMAGPTQVTPDTLQWILGRVVDLHLPFKATQGLHHPLVSAQHPHGFLNLATALRLRQCLGPDAFTDDHVAACLATTDPRNYAFSHDTMAWDGHEATVRELEDAHRDLPFTIGSCSLREPDEELARHFP